MWLLDSLFPRRCVGCGSEGSWLCHNCTQWNANGWPREVYPGVTALAPLSERFVREGIHTLKYHSIGELAELLVAACWGESVGGVVLLPVPTSFARRKQRGFNQAELIARAIARRTGAHVYTKGLTKLSRGTLVGKGRAERQHVQYSWRGEVPKGAMLVDDVVTTGSTLAACRAAIGQPVPALVLAATQAPGATYTSDV